MHKGKKEMSHLIGVVVSKDEEDTQIMSWLWNLIQPELAVHVCLVTFAPAKIVFQDSHLRKMIGLV